MADDRGPSSAISNNPEWSMDKMNNFSQSDLSAVEYDLFVENDIPVIVYLCILCVVGTTGNVHAITVYAFRYKPSNHRTFVIWLATVDLVASFLSMPFESFDIRYNLTFSIIPLCKIFKGLNYFVSICSGFLLGVIAVERYRKICVPLGTQLSLRLAKWTCFVAVMIAFILACISGFMYGIISKQVPSYNLTASECTVLGKYKGTMLFKGYSVFLLFISTVVFVLCVVTYSFVGKILYKQMTFRKLSHSSADRRLTSNPNGNDRNISHDTGSSVHQEEESSFAHGTHKESTAVTSPKENMKKKRKKGLDRSKQIAFMFLVATAASYVGYLPNMILLIIKGIRSDTYDAIDQRLGVVNAILVRSYFLSNVANPIVYCFVDERFRRECTLLYRRLYTKCKRLNVKDH